MTFNRSLELNGHDIVVLQVSSLQGLSHCLTGNESHCCDLQPRRVHKLRYQLGHQLFQNLPILQKQRADVPNDPESPIRELLKILGHSNGFPLSLYRYQSCLSSDGTIRAVQYICPSQSKILQLLHLLYLLLEGVMMRSEGETRLSVYKIVGVKFTWDDVHSQSDVGRLRAFVAILGVELDTGHFLLFGQVDRVRKKGRKMALATMSLTHINGLYPPQILTLEGNQQ